MTKVAGVDDNDETAVAIHQLEDIVAIILSWLHIKEIMRSRRVCKKWTEAVRKTIVPCNFSVNSMQRYNAMDVMTTEMPNLQQITIGGLEWGHKYADGEDPHEDYAARTAHHRSHDIEIISNFNKLRILAVDYNAPLSGRYPVFFNSFPLLQKLNISLHYFKWDLEMLAGLPLLKELGCYCNYGLGGNIKSLRVLEDTLEKVIFYHCDHVEGNFMDLADFPRLRELDLNCITMTGDIRDIGSNDFPMLERLSLPKTVYGGRGYKLQRISDAPELIRAVYLFKQQRPALVDINYWCGKLSEDSPDWYESAGEYFPAPLCIRFIQAGSRVGYRWATPFPEETVFLCEVNWLDPEPDRESSDYRQYIEELQKIENEVGFYRGFHQPPTEEEYQRLCEERG